ncbi:pesticidal protein Cry7Aa [Flavobacterium sp. N1719]|uniref:glycoside hydrolase family 130 protein n=1 Tax=Flavobacterium sp. N1719 TaxID=2885633 RepID=UPI0022237C0E|nr:pesticidal protein Cry7Aa [Flavobacterium sp. N1719]
MLTTVQKKGLLLEKTTHGFENLGVLNPAVIHFNGMLHVFYRAINKEHFSSIGYALLDEQSRVIHRNEVPTLYPQFDYECLGVEDPRIVCIDTLFYLTYTAFDGINARGALALSIDMVHWEKKGIIVPQLTYTDFMHRAESILPLNEKYHRYNNPTHVNESFSIHKVWDKNVIFFPRRIKGQLCMLHRIKPDIQIVFFNELADLNTAFWDDYLLHFSTHILLSPRFEHEVSYLGGGCPPIETVAGWILIYHGVHDTLDGYVYSCCVALLDLENPSIEVARLPYPLFGPEHDYEVHGIINNICFPSGAVVLDDVLHIYYGAADKRVAWASVPLQPLLKALEQNHSHNNDA